MQFSSNPTQLNVGTSEAPTEFRKKNLFDEIVQTRSLTGGFERLFLSFPFDIKIKNRIEAPNAEMTFQ